MLHCPGAGEYGEEAGPKDVPDCEHLGGEAECR